MKAESLRDDFDVVVIGAGPSGAAAALRLGELGHRVGIVERARFPRPHVGICLSDESLDLLAHLGLKEPFEAGKFWRRKVTHVNWGKGGAREVNQNGFHVDRGRLDQALLERACQAQAVLFQPARVVNGSFRDTEGWILDLDRDGLESRVRARFLVDAGGRHSALRGPRTRDTEPLLALHADWRFDTAPRADGLIEACDVGWLWFAQTHRDQGSMTLFLDPRASDELTKSNLKAWYLDRLACFSTAEWLDAGYMISQVKACDATSSHAAEPLTDRFVRVGDAAMTVDPLASQGVHLALLSGLQASIVVNTILREPRNADFAEDFYRERVAERVTRYKVRTGQEYARVAEERASNFWLSRAAESSPPTGPTPTASLKALKMPPSSFAVSPELQIENAPVIEGSFVRERRILRHPRLETGVKYLAGMDLVQLLEELPDRLSLEQLESTWSSHMPRIQAARIASWLLERQILVGARGPA